jgi:uncharacterized protein (TIGR02246 family)
LQPVSTGAILNPQGRELVTDSIDAADRAALAAIIADLETAWNAGDGAAFAAPFADDADFVNIRADHFRGRNAIAGGHAGIFRTIYAGSVNRYTVEAARLLHADVALVHVHAALDVPSGPVAGHHSARFSAVFTRELEGWRIAAFHNTLAPPAQESPR